MPLTPNLTPDAQLELASNNDRVFAFIIDYFLANICVIPVWFISRNTTWFFILGIPLLNNFDDMWKQLKSKYTTELSALAYGTIPDEEHVSLCFRELMNRILSE